MGTLFVAAVAPIPNWSEVGGFLEHGDMLDVIADDTDRNKVWRVVGKSGARSLYLNVGGRAVMVPPCANRGDWFTAWSSPSVTYDVIANSYKFLTHMEYVSLCNAMLRLWNNPKDIPALDAIDDWISRGWEGDFVVPGGVTWGVHQLVEINRPGFRVRDPNVMRSVARKVARLIPPGQPKEIHTVVQKQIPFDRIIRGMRQILESR